MSKLFFYLPFTYFLKSRLKSINQRLSWILIYIIPTFFMAVYYDKMSSTLIELIIIYLLSLIAVYCTYEIGYIQNDCETIKKEPYPTIRLSSKEFKYYEKNKVSIWLSRCIITLICLSSLFILTGVKGFFIFFALILLILFLYLIYNNTNSRWKIMLHFILVYIRFMSFPLLVFSDVYLEPSYWLLILIFPLPNLIERASLKKFDFTLPSLMTGKHNSIDRFRFYYYLVIGIIAAILAFRSNEYWLFLVLAIYFFIYRLLIFFRIFAFAKRT